MEYLKKLCASLLIVSAFVTVLFTTAEPEAHAAFRPSGYVGKLLTRLNEGGSETSFRTTPGTAPDGTSLSTAKIGDYIVLTINPGGANEEKISATAVAVSGTSATWTIGTRGLSFTEAAQVADNVNQHAIGETVIISNDDHFLYTQYTANDDDEVITGSWSFPTPTAAANPVTKAYADNLAAGGTLNVDRVQVAGTAGQTLAAGNIVSFNTTDARWYLTDTDVATSTNFTILGIAQGAGTGGGSISGGVLLSGLDTNQSGLAAGSRYFASATGGGVSSATTSRSLGMARSATSLYFVPDFTGPLALNGLQYTFPATQGAASTTLINNGSGTLTWSGYSSLLRASSTAFTVDGASNTASTTVYDATIPANTLGTQNAVRVTMFGLSATGNSDQYFEVAYGNATSTFQSPSTSIATSTRMTVTVMADGATNAQYISTEWSFMGGQTGTWTVASSSQLVKSGSVDSTTAQKLLVVGRNRASGNVFRAGRALTEVLRNL